MTYKIATPYHPHTSVKLRCLNHDIKSILQKTIRPNRKDWSLRLRDTLWGHRIAYKTPIGMSTFQLLFGKSYYLSLELEHYAFWVIKTFNFNMKHARSNRRLQLNELDELCNKAYENAKIYKAKTKAFHDKNDF